MRKIVVHAALVGAALMSLAASARSASESEAEKTGKAMPLFLMQGIAQAGVTWQSEALFQEQAGHPITHVDIPA